MEGSDSELYNPKKNPESLRYQLGSELEAEHDGNYGNTLRETGVIDQADMQNWALEAAHSEQAIKRSSDQGLNEITNSCFIIGWASPRASRICSSLNLPRIIVQAPKLPPLTRCSCRKHCWGLNCCRRVQSASKSLGWDANHWRLWGTTRRAPSSNHVIGMPRECSCWLWADETRWSRAD